MTAAGNRMDRESEREPLDNLLKEWRAWDRAAGQEVIALAHADLRRLACFFRHEGAGHTLQPTALVNEVFLRLSSGAHVSFKDRTHFFAVAARQMRRVLIDHARSTSSSTCGRSRRGGREPRSRGTRRRPLGGFTSVVAVRANGAWDFAGHIMEPDVA